MKYTPKQIGELVRRTRHQMALTQKDLALAADTGLRFIIDLEKGKPTCQLGKVLTVLQAAGVIMGLTPPESTANTEDLAQSDPGQKNLVEWD